MQALTRAADATCALWPSLRARRVDAALAARDPRRLQSLDVPAVRALQIPQLHKLNAFLAVSDTRLPHWEDHVERDTLEAATLRGGYAVPFHEVAPSHLRWLERVAGPLRRGGLTSSGASTAHLAARWGLKSFLDGLTLDQRSAQDVHGRTPGHVAAAYGHTALAICLATKLRDRWGRSVTDYLLADSRPVDSNVRPALPGWPTCQVDRSEKRSHCGIIESISAWPDLDSFAARGRPALLHSSLETANAYQTWTPDYLRNLLGSIPLRATSWWPFAAKGSIRDHILPEKGVYVFETIPYKLLRQDLPLLPHAFVMREPQIAIGALDTGAPFHSHFPSISLLLHGTKMWRLVPPCAAQWSLKAFGHAGSDVVEVEQRAGEVMLIPDAWAHATRLLSTCVSVTFEFVPSGHLLRD